MLLDPRATLLVVDMQDGFDDAVWGSRNNPALETNVGMLLAAWRACGAHVIHVHHDSLHPSGRLRPGTPGNAPKREAAPLAGEPIYRKHVNSAFVGTTLERDLRARNLGSLVIVGLTTNHCISTTARFAGNLGFETFVVSDATATFDRLGLDGRLRLANDVHNAALSDLQGEFAEIIDTETAVAARLAPVSRMSSGGVHA